MELSFRFISLADSSDYLFIFSANFLDTALGESRLRIFALLVNRPQ